MTPSHAERAFVISRVREAYSRLIEARETYFLIRHPLDSDFTAALDLLSTFVTDESLKLVADLASRYEAPPLFKEDGRGAEAS